MLVGAGALGAATEVQQVGPAWDQALSARRPVVYEAYTDPEVPPHIDFKQVRNFMLSTVLDRDTPGIVKGSLLETAQNVCRITNEPLRG